MKGEWLFNEEIGEWVRSEDVVRYVQHILEGEAQRIAAEDPVAAMAGMYAAMRVLEKNKIIGGDK